jgi:hypothetical protein
VDAEVVCGFGLFCQIPLDPQQLPVVHLSSGGEIPADGGSLLIQDGASLVYVKEQMGHSSIQITVDTYGHLIPGADIAWVDRLDAKTTQQQSATGTQQAETEPETESVEVTEKIWLPPRDSNPDMLIQSPFSGSENKENPATPSADSGKVLQNPQPPRNRKAGE